MRLRFHTLHAWFDCNRFLLGFTAPLLLALCAAVALHSPGVQASSAAIDAEAWPSMSLTPLINGLAEPVFVGNANDGSGRLFVVEREGTIRIFAGNSLLATPFLSITTRVESGYGEQGLLSVAFPPNFASKRHFYAYYTQKGTNALIISRFNVSTDANVADAGSETALLNILHPTNLNHDGGQLQFSPHDGFLYLGTGDGGASGDPPNNAQTPSVLLGKILRIDPETAFPTVPTYTIPASNPFVGATGYRPEIWALGLRNPWRFSFDRATHDLYIGDVGQDTWEEVDWRPAASTGGENYGWRVLEGDMCYPPGTTSCTPPPNYVAPVATVEHGAGDCAIIGGYVYRGTRFVLLRGIYFYGDNCSGRVWGLKYVSGAWQSHLLKSAGFSISSFGEDEAGNLYVADLYGGRVLRVDGAPEKSVYLPVTFR